MSVAKTFIHRLEEPRYYEDYDNVGWRGNLLNGALGLLAFVVGGVAFAILMNVRDWNPMLSTGDFVFLLVLALAMIILGYMFVYANVAAWEWWSNVLIGAVAVILAVVASWHLHNEDVDSTLVLVSLVLCIVGGALIACVMFTRWDGRIRWNERRPNNN